MYFVFISEKMKAVEIAKTFLYTVNSHINLIDIKPFPESDKEYTLII